MVDSRKLKQLTPFADDKVTTGGPDVLVNWWSLFAAQGNEIAPWWSPTRDTQLRDLVRKSDQLSGAMGKVSSYVAGTPIKIVPIDTRRERFIRKAQELTDRLNTYSGMLRGFSPSFNSFLYDYYNCDNGGHALVLGSGPADGQIQEAWGIDPLDSLRCTRTGNIEFPIVYQHKDGKKYKLHHSRVISMERLPSTDAAMHHMGFSSVSSCYETVQTLIGMEQYNQERVGSRTPSMIAQSALPAAQIWEAFKKAEEQMLNRGDAYYSKLVVVGNVDKDERIDFRHTKELPDTFDYRTKVVLSMFVIALSFGVGARLIWPNSDVGATKADAMIQNLQTRHSSPGQILGQFTHQLTLKFCPKGYEAVADFQDDEARVLHARTADLYSRQRERDTKTGAFSLRTMRQQALAARSITQEQFEVDELGDGRLPDGTEVINQFYSNSQSMQTLLYLGVDDPLDIENNDTEAMLTAIDARIRICRELIINGSARDRANAGLAKAALEELRDLYDPPAPIGEETEPEEDDPDQAEDEDVEEDEDS